MDNLEIINSVDEFYNSAWNKLILFTTLLVAIVGVLIPLIITWWQNRTLKIRERIIKEDLERELENSLKNIETDILDRIMKKLNSSITTIKSEVEDRFDNIDKKIRLLNIEVDEKISRVDAGTFHIQGNNLLIEGFTYDAIRDFFVAGHGYFKGNDMLNIGRINNLLKENINRLTKQEKIRLNKEEEEPTKYINLLKEYELNDFFLDFIDDLKGSTIISK